MANDQVLSDETIADVRTIVDHLHATWRRGYRGGELFGKLTEHSRQELKCVTGLCYLLKRMENEWEIDWVDVEMPGRQDENGRRKSSLVTLFFSMRDAGEDNDASEDIT